MKSIADIRKDYKLQSLHEKDIQADPFAQFANWFDAAVSSEVDEVNAMTLATADASAKPSARIVLLKGFDEEGFIFFSNYESRKGKEMAVNPQAALVFFWKELERQVRVEGKVVKLSDAENDIYFYSRPEGSQIGAIASPQSSIISSREILEEAVRKIEASKATEKIVRPLHWGGYKVIAESIEFWQGRSSRLHDRLQFSKQADGSWKIDRLAP